MNRAELADFLRRGRARLAPSDVGLTPGSRRRTPGLRREEVAQLAGMSVDYYTRMEQSRGPRPSRQMLTALSRALRLSDVEQDHLFHLAGEEPPRRETASSHVRPGLLLILDRLHDTPAQVVNDCGEVLAQNTMAKALVGDVMSRPRRERNFTRRFFLDPTARTLFPQEDHAGHARTHVATLRAVAAARPDDPEPAALVAELLASSEEFARLWDEHEVSQRNRATKRFIHPLVGLLELDCEVMISHSHHHLLVVHSARPGTEAYERLQLLRVVGLQDMTPTKP
ncbi:helix-turn-helix domain-containing protein [Streptomyces lincolnensis]|uniref:Helix-turn-helix domain-containing protein n=1 Tax=Streptomyces lincolnensis TaxID=1915 RepID=A0A1B1M948_STRLN|nr:helix-turn-helix transcriptional regulator [Streptomyces lincolnensis]ANS65149.1 helix-turn-helix domain-containing protein [Streptomyces lincolnensis]AXG56643.1 helix-turn-helix domain-containing protein [Streptomyces lincolnensis]QMV06929.1 helix-turn-helix domain-containing protein [Streptomyces lincolnensis]